MLEPEFDKSFFVLSVIGIWILRDGALDTEEGREKVKGAFRDAMLAGSSTFEELCLIPEIKTALEDIERVQNGESVEAVAMSRMFPPSPNAEQEGL